MNARDRQKMYEQEMGVDALARQKRAAASRCSACGQAVRWARSRDGKRIAVDYDPHEAGSVLVWPDGHSIATTPGATPPEKATLHFLHSATCRERTRAPR